MQKKIFIGVCALALCIVLNSSINSATHQETRQLFMILSFPNNTQNTRIIEVSPNQTVQSIRLALAKSLGMWPHLLTFFDKGREVPDQLAIGFEIGETPQEALNVRVNIQVIPHENNR